MPITRILLRTLILQHAVHELDQILGRRQSEGLFPQSGGLVADQDDVLVTLLVFHELAQFLEDVGVSMTTTLPFSKSE